MPRRFSGSAAVLAYLDLVPSVASIRHALQRNQGPCPRAVSVEADAQHDPCPAPAIESGSPEASSSSSPQVWPDRCSLNGTHLVTV